jgi:hypothetical protein
MVTKLKRVARMDSLATVVWRYPDEHFYTTSKTNYVCLTYKT